VLLSGLKMSWPEARLRAREYKQLAMKKPTSSAYAISSRMYLDRRQHKEAISELERGLALDPNSPRCISDMGRALTMAGRPKEGIEYHNKWLRLDPRDRYRYLINLGLAHFCLGNIAEAATLIEQAMRINPEDASIATTLAGFYGALGRDQDARAMLDYRRKYPGAPPNLGVPMFIMPWKDPVVAKRYAEGLLKAGLPPAKISGGYFPAFKENQLTGEEIKSLLFGSRVIGTTADGQQWRIDHQKNGEFIWSGPSDLAGPSSDKGKIRIEDDMVFTRYQKRWWGLEFCSTVFRNPKGTNGAKDEYFYCHDIGFSAFSLVK